MSEFEERIFPSIIGFRRLSLCRSSTFSVKWGETGSFLPKGLVVVGPDAYARQLRDSRLPEPGVNIIIYVSGSTPTNHARVMFDADRNPVQAETLCLLDIPSKGVQLESAGEGEGGRTNTSSLSSLLNRRLHLHPHWSKQMCHYRPFIQLRLRVLGGRKKSLPGSERVMSSRPFAVVHLLSYTLLIDKFRSQLSKIAKNTLCGRSVT